MIVTNIIEVYFRQKKQKKKVKVRSCFGCIHSRRYDSTGKEVMELQYSLKKQKGGDVVG